MYRRGLWLVVVVGFVALVLWWGVRKGSLPIPAEVHVELPAKPSSRHPTTIRRPEQPRIPTGSKDAQGLPITISCGTCHALRPSNLQTRTGKELKEFHQGLQVQHGKLTCVSCHNPADYETLRLADGRAVSFSNVMQLCSQCHGSQARDYEHGAHGGMVGYWDRHKGARQRHNCIDCHDPHAPAYPRVQPVFPPQDRFPPPSGH